MPEISWGPYSSLLDGLGPLSQAGDDRVGALGQSGLDIAQLKTLAYAAAAVAGLRSAFTRGVACKILVNLTILLGISAEHTSGRIPG
jgi:hypothetical protein